MHNTGQFAEQYQAYKYILIDHDRSPTHFPLGAKSHAYLPTVLAAVPELTLIRSRCPAKGLTYLDASLKAANYQPVAELDMRLAQGEDVMIAAPETIVTMYRRADRFCTVYSVQIPNFGLILSRSVALNL